MSNPTYMSREGLEKLKEDLHDLKTRQRHAEYDAAKDAQGLLEMRIAQLEDLYSNARVVDDSSIDTDKVHILSNVKLLNKKTNTEVTYRIVSTNEASLKDGKISIESPIGKGLLGKAVGDEVEIEVPAGKVTLKVLDITR